ncbi:dTDP-4-dehydrorhamnose reductase [Allomuricauda sp. SCSIO 65647]|uniref:dTDP-4-dehydrorhamnose reductase n=1 Tax=Allomuricauda sp. SCSIO 65647 TaxID=2908843 RepID=UPI001F275EB7|nr:dTDP-4-dehydrorhamnose reductase [Muricauda sp. SCSIO 65647]UJH69046.1 dTDP-4-dehydrorhamnose reductase [Muricauda sp. SCSIO 65647]
MKKILVTGASGQLGLTLQELAPGYPELEFDFRDSNQLDITDTTALKQAFVRYEHSYCINCAAYTQVEEAEKHPKKAFEVNADAVKQMAELCLQNNVVLIHLSTDYVFDGEKGSPYYPDDEPNPINEYGKSKLEGERHIQKMLDRFYIVRTSWLYSKKYGNNFYRTILAKARAGEVLRVTDQQTGCPTNTLSLSEFLIEKLVQGKKKFGIHHFSDGKVMTWYGFAKKILDEQKLSDKIELLAVQKYQALAPRPKKSVIMP